MGRCEAKNRYGKACRCAPLKGGRLCYMHEPSNKPLPRYYNYVVGINLKPYERLPDGRYKRHIIGKVFTSRDEAWAWLHANWAYVSRPRPGKRFVSATVESFKGAPPPDSVTQAADALLNHIVEKYGLHSRGELRCPHMWRLARAVALEKGGV